MADSVHISSLLLRAIPEQVQDVCAAVEREPAAEVALSDAEGKIIVTLETPSESDIVETMNRLQLLDGVVSTALIYHQEDTGAERAPV